MTPQQLAKWNMPFIDALLGALKRYSKEPQLPKESDAEYVSRLYREARITNHTFLLIQQQVIAKFA